jgi:hypothetical protein
MRVQKRIHNILLALFLTAIFIAPLAIKGVHYHIDQSLHNAVGCVLSSPEKDCPICQFEFVTFFSDNQEQYFYPFTARFVRNAKPVSQEVQFSFVFYFHRGPPIS